MGRPGRHPDARAQHEQGASRQGDPGPDGPRGLHARGQKDPLCPGEPDHMAGPGRRADHGRQPLHRHTHPPGARLPGARRAAHHGHLPQRQDPHRPREHAGRPPRRRALGGPEPEPGRPRHRAWPPQDGNDAAPARPIHRLFAPPGPGLGQAAPPVQLPRPKARPSPDRVPRHLDQQAGPRRHPRRLRQVAASPSTFSCA